MRTFGVPWQFVQVGARRWQNSTDPKKGLLKFARFNGRRVDQDRSMDRVRKSVRSKIMAAVRTRDTGAEKAVRSIVHGLGYRYSLNRSDLPGKPDLAFVARKKAIFVHGCFWHGHSCRYGRLPKSRLHYWGPKIVANKARDRRNVRGLKGAGWSVMVVWQCQLKKKEAMKVRLGSFLNE
jgi:DNA mismatch endonuclease (patch repair protein)